MKWVTRARPKIDRVACPWLIRKFVDPQAEFLFVLRDQVRAVAEQTGAIPFDVEGVELGHDGPLCSFDTIIRRYKLSDAAQMLIMQSYDAFNAAQTIEMKRPDAALLWSYRERVVGDFYDGVFMKLKMLGHVVRRSSSLQDVAAYLTLMGRKYDPGSKARQGRVMGTPPLPSGQSATL